MGSADHPTYGPRRGGHPHPDDPALAELRSRLDALQSSVERLGTEEERPPPDPAGTSYGTGAGTQGASPPPPPPSPAHPSAAGYAPPPPPPPTGMPAHTAPPPQYRPAPAATNGHGTDGQLSPTADVAVLDVGPFRDLIDLRHFEDAVNRLETVRDVRVRRVGHGRAELEIAVVGPYPITRELFRLGRPLRVEAGPGGGIIVEFTDLEPEPQGEQPDQPQPDQQQAQQPGAAPDRTEPTAGDRGASSPAGEGDEA